MLAHITLTCASLARSLLLTAATAPYRHAAGTARRASMMFGDPSGVAVRIGFSQVSAARRYGTSGARHPCNGSVMVVAKMGRRVFLNRFDLKWSATVEHLECPFCKIVATKTPTRIIFETASTLSFFPLHPATPGHTLVIPKDHAPDLWSIGKGSFLDTMSTARRVANVLKQVLDPEGMNIINSTGSAATQTIFHFHVHLVPRWSDDAIGDIWPRGDVVPAELTGRLEELVREACMAIES
jgi:histidine triad (HIT) family protein